MPIPPTLVSANDELFEDEEKPIGEEEQHDVVFDVLPIDSSPYPDSSSYQDLAETHVEDPTESKTITTHRKSIRVSSYKRATSPPLSSISSKKTYPTLKWTPELDEWIREESSGFYDVRCDHIPEDPMDKVISILVLQVVEHRDRICQVEDDRDSLTKEIRLIAGRVKGLENRRNIDEIWILHIYDHLEETHYVVQYQ
ncbi:unnamed protein product [Lactuca saligna]|uniref:Uncharacterized protein n=1 Tax=Lactuca saligna TaxID=75948 RepID=A0AA35V7A0_LACSI|nr:unnamed protein product [Lactuca saligna]